MDKLYEFDREPVSEDRLQGPGKFMGLFAGEHVAGTEFVIGAFFVLHGVSLSELIWGLLLGNLLAVLSWTFVCAPIAVQTRLTIYWYFRRIAGPVLMVVYNVVNAVLYCVIAGAMIAVAATAVALGFGIPSPELTDVFPGSAGWVAITFVVGSVITVIAILGFEKLSQFSQLCSPWVFTVFVAGAVAMLTRLGVESDLGNLLEVARTQIWTGEVEGGAEKYGFWHIVFFAWFCNAAFHLGLSDMAVFRYAPHWKYGLFSAFGMYPGHMLAWICSGVMVAAVEREMNPGLMAYEAAGLAGAFAVLVAGWTTANPTIYRSGLALQVVSPNWPRWKVTLIAGMITTVLSCFPVIFMKLLDYVAAYGLILVPIGAVVLCEHFVFPRLSIEQFVTGKEGRRINGAAALTWAVSLGAAMLMPVHLFFKPLPAYLIALVLYTALRKGGMK